jgi:hypothetical protein
MHRPEAGAIVTMEVLVEQQVFLPGWVGLHEFDAPVDGPSAVRAGEPDTDQPVGKIAGDNRAELNADLSPSDIRL